MKRKVIAVLLSVMVAVASFGCGAKNTLSSGAGAAAGTTPATSSAAPSQGPGNAGSYWDGPDSKEINQRKNQEILNNASKLRRCELSTADGCKVISTYLPDDWMASAVMNYRYSPSFPMQAIATLDAPDRSHGIIYFSPMSFLDQTNYSDGQRTPDDGSQYIMEYCIYRHYREAYEVSDLMLSLLGYTWQDRDSLPIDSALAESYRAQAQEIGRAHYEELRNQLSGFSYEAFNLARAEGSIDCSRGWITNGTPLYAETTTCVRMYDLDFVSGSFPMINMRMGNDRTIWQYDGFSVYWAVDEETFLEHYDMAQFILQNTGTTASFEAAQQQFLSVIIPQIINGKTDVMNYGTDLVRQTMQNWNDTNDRVAQMWDDYILDQDRYVSSTGAEFAVPTTADYVYYDSDSSQVIWTDSALFEPGPEYEQLNRKN